MDDQPTPNQPSPGESTAAPATAATYSDPALLRPRLSILHLMIWTALSAAYLAQWRWKSTNANFQLTWQLAAWCLPIGGLWLGAGLWVVWRIRGLRYPFFAGEWLLATLGTASLLMILAFASLPLGSQAIMWADIGLELAVAGVLGVVLVRQRFPLRWRLALVAVVAAAPLKIGVKQLSGLLLSDGRMGLLVESLVRLLPAAVVLVAGLIDWRRELRLPWTHWLGVLLEGVLAVLTLISVVDMLLNVHW